MPSELQNFTTMIDLFPLHHAAASLVSSIPRNYLNSSETHDFLNGFCLLLEVPATIFSRKEDFGHLMTFTNKNQRFLVEVSKPFRRIFQFF